MEYKTESRIMRTNQEWICYHCGKAIPLKSKIFARIKELGDKILKKDETFYYEKDYRRYHLECAQSLKDLTLVEKEIIKSANKFYIGHEDILKEQIGRILYRYEKLNLLSFLFVKTFKRKINNNWCSVGKKGISDLIVFCPNGITLFCELKAKYKKLGESQVKYSKLLNQLGHKYVEIHTVSEFWYFLRKYADLPEKTLEEQLRV